MEKETNSAFYDYSNLIGLIYDAAQEPVLWPELLDELNLFLGEKSNCQHSTELNTLPKKELLESHFHRAINMNQRIHRLERENQTSTEILNRLPIGLIITDSDAVPVAMNDRAKLLLECNQGLRINQGVLTTHNAPITEKLHRLIQESSLGWQSGEGKSLIIHDADGRNNTSIWITSSAINQTQHDDNKSLAALYIASPLIRPEFSVDALQQNYNLTIAEARLIKTLANGCHNMNEAAEKLELSIHTVRTQIKHIFEKTDTGNQMELIKKVLTDPSILIGKQQQPQSALSYKQEHGSLLNSCSTIKLYDGRNLSYAEYGDPEGKPVLMFHGITGSRLQYPAEETTAKELGLRIIIADRPGHGFSDPHNNRDLLDWPDDVLQLANQLGLDRFSILGFVAGCAYALACAYKIPERIDKVSLVSARGPVDKFSDLLTVDGAILQMARFTPKLLNKSIQIMLSDIIRDPIKGLEKRYKHLCEQDKQLIDKHPKLREMYAAALIESTRQGIQGVTQDLITVMQEWGFVPEDIPLPVRLWHGEEDRGIPVRAARKLADELPNCVATFVANIGGFLIIYKWDEILTDLAEGLPAASVE